MGLRALRPSAAICKVMSVPDSRCVRVVTPDNHVNLGFHEIIIHDLADVGDSEQPRMPTVGMAKAVAYVYVSLSV